MAATTTEARFLVKASEMKRHMEERAHHHEERLAFYKAEETRWKKALEEYGDVGQQDDMAKSRYSNDKNLRDAASQGVKTHDQAARRFRFLATHLTGDDYALTMEELVALAFIPSGYGF